MQSWNWGITVSQPVPSQISLPREGSRQPSWGRAWWTHPPRERRLWPPAGQLFVLLGSEVGPRVEAPGWCDLRSSLSLCSDPRAALASLWPPRKPTTTETGLQHPWSQLRLSAACPSEPPRQALGTSSQLFPAQPAIPGHLGQPSPQVSLLDCGSSYSRFVMSAPTFVWGSLRASSSRSPTWTAMAWAPSALCAFLQRREAGSHARHVLSFHPPSAPSHNPGLSGPLGSPPSSWSRLLLLRASSLMARLPRTKQEILPKGALPPGPSKVRQHGPLRLKELWNLFPRGVQSYCSSQHLNLYRFFSLFFTSVSDPNLSPWRGVLGANQNKSQVLGDSKEKIH